MRGRPRGRGGRGPGGGAGGRGPGGGARAAGEGGRPPGGCWGDPYAAGYAPPVTPQPRTPRPVSGAVPPLNTTHHRVELRPQGNNRSFSGSFSVKYSLLALII